MFLAKIKNGMKRNVRLRRSDIIMFLRGGSDTRIGGGPPPDGKIEKSSFRPNFSESARITLKHIGIDSYADFTS